MRTIAIASPKGGSGKSTLAACLAVHATTKRQRVALWDLDPQRSLEQFHAHRLRETGDECRPILLSGRTLGEALQGIADGADGLDWLVIDCPPGSVLTTAAAIGAAHLVVVPCRPSPLDVESMPVVADECRRSGRPFVFVLTNVLTNNRENRSMRDGARQYLSSLGTVLDVEVALRTSYASSMVSGRTGPERDDAAAREVAELWSAITKRVGRG